MTNALLAVLLLQTFTLPPRGDLVKPALEAKAGSAKDYDKVWKAFLSGADDAKTLQEADKLLKKEKALEPALLTLKAYMDLYRGDTAGAERQFEAVLQR